MFIFRHGGKRVAQVLRPAYAATSHRLASRIAIPFTPPPFPVIETCPSPTCQCREAPAGLEIEREQSLNGSMAAYAEQILISTGKNDWKSRIEEEEGAVLIRQMKKLLLKGGKYVDPYHNVMISNSSIQPEIAPDQQPVAPTQDNSTEASKDRLISLPESGPPASAFLLPSFKYIPAIPTDTKSVETFIQAFVLPQKLHSIYETLTAEQHYALLRKPELQRQFAGVRNVEEILILVCGHGGRDDRCGKMAPVLMAEFEEKLQSSNIAILKGVPTTEAIKADVQDSKYLPPARIASISHIGGHKFAGNVIVYIPPSFRSNPLAGNGIWYGRVGPEHVEGIVAKTILDGQVIKDQFRGGIDGNGGILRL
ncbi:related to sucrose cleavage protein [Ramularia collo-cygni]|uniref:Altered inheritance of mitochondria protein 32 n=1 Tax=Ramularia collo-cygni TaxID=112498 RepID=A0A2D3V892_9PEZI|nr:related to sucrose cleavage protein [Ramularia collo-cygni]CZT18794.1 related to sucrose cleavage protein [Ramularia collo-cygni]